MTTIYDMTTCDMIDPVGIDSAAPIFGWKMRSDEIGQRQTAYQIIVRSGDKTQWDSGRVLSDRSIGVVYGGQKLLSSTVYSWKVYVWDRRGEAVCSEDATFETALLGEFPFSGSEWISCAESGSSLPAFRKQLSIRARLVSAKLYTSGLGVYESYINGERVGGLKRDKTAQYHELKPGSTEMGVRKFYNSYDITWMIGKQTDIALSAVVAGGWWSGRVAANHGKEDAYLARLVLNYEGGGQEIIGTDTTWKAARACNFLFADIYDGETYDARVSKEWMTVGFDDSGWDYAEINDEFKGEICSAQGVNIIVRHDLQRGVESVNVYDGVIGAKDGQHGKVNIVKSYENSSFTLPKGHTTVVDFGQNFAGWEAFCVEGREGTAVTVRHAEMLNDGNGAISRGNDGAEGSIYTANYRSAKSTTEYILNGKGRESYHPTFTYYGFRYIQITATDTVTFHSIVGQVVTSVERETGFLGTSDPQINRLISNIRWGQYSNYLSVPTDCPQRDERLGWTADTQVFSETGAYLGYSKSFLEKFMQDMRDSQRADGAWPGTSPTGQYLGADWGGFGWADAGIIVPYNVYAMYGDAKIIKDNWQAMAKYMDYLSKTNKLGGLPVWGDHLSFESNDDVVRKMLGISYYALDAKLMAEMAGVMGYLDLAEKYGKVYMEEKEFFQALYVNADGTLRRNEQTVCLYALYLDLLPNAVSFEAVKNQLLRNIAGKGCRLQTGFLGTAIIMPTLTRIGESDMAYELLFQNNNPSWLYSVEQGATTTWERWNSYTVEDGFGDASMNSFNHYAYGAVGSWMFKCMAGIGYDSSEPGFKKIIFRPQRTDRFKSVSATYESAYGGIKSAWRYANSAWHYDIVLPANTTAEAVIEVADINLLSVNGKKADGLKVEEEGIEFKAFTGGTARFELVSGAFKFKIALPKK